MLLAKRVVPCLIFISFSLVFISKAYSQNLRLPSNEQITELEEITVTGSSSNASDATRTLTDLYKAQDSSNLGALLNDELGASSTAFGNNASRPILRGMSGNRVPILQNSMGGSDLSSLSNDHAVSAEPIFIQKIQVLRGSDALRFGSGSNAGLITIENNRIAEELIISPYSEVQLQYGPANSSTLTGLLTEGSTGQWSLHADGVKKSTTDYIRPDGLRQNYSSSDLSDIGFGATYHREHSYSGISYGEYRNFYGIPSIEGSFIDMLQKRLDLVHVEKNPLPHLTQIDLKYAYTNYHHTELSAQYLPQTTFQNLVHQIRLEAFHDPLGRWQGSVGLQLSSGQLSALDLTSSDKVAAVIPKTQSDNLAFFAVENTSISDVDFKTGIRYESSRLNPDSTIPYSDQPNFSNAQSFKAPLKTTVQNNLFSGSGSAFWNYAKGYKTGLTLQITQRAPAVDELFSYGNHDATASFDIGNSSLTKETAYQLEWGWKKTQGLIQSQVNLYQNKTMNYIYGAYLSTVDQVSNYPVRQFSQANALLTGYEAEVLYNPDREGLSARLFSDGTKGTFEDASNLPLQPAIRIGGNVAYRQGLWSSRVSFIHGLGQTRLASFENYPTPSYNKLDLRIARKFQAGLSSGEIYLLGNNLLNDTIRYSTTIESIRMNAPQAGRNLMLGLRLSY